jgi:CTP:molybdopterin cytidylyltransferase MocA
LAGLLRKLKLHARDVPVADEFIHADMDTPEDYRRLAGLLER